MTYPPFLLDYDYEKWSYKVIDYLSPLSIVQVCQPPPSPAPPLGVSTATFPGPIIWTDV